MLKPSDLTKAELLQVVEMLAMETGPYYLDRALGRIRLKRNDAHHEGCCTISGWITSRKTSLAFRRCQQIGMKLKNGLKLHGRESHE